MNIIKASFILIGLMLVSGPALSEDNGMFNNVDVGLVYTYNDNVPRAAYGYQRRDSIISATAAKSYRKSTGKQTQFVYGWSGSVDQYLKYELLSHVRLGVNGRWQYRSTGAFTAPTYSLLARIYSDSYRSSLRSGTTLSLGGSVRKAITDRVTVTGLVEATQRDASSIVFDTNNTSARVNLDYLLSQQSTVYLTYNHIKGDITYSADWAAPYTGYIYDAWQADDAFYANWRAYRMSGTTQVTTLGYNYSFSEKSALDLAVFNAKSNVYNGPYYSSTVVSFAWLKRL